MSVPRSLDLRVYYEDTDAGGVVYYANYLRYAERARTEWLRERGVDLAEWTKKGTIFVVTETTLRLHRPARYGDLLTVDTALVSSGGATLDLLHRIRRGDDLLVENPVRLCAVGADLKPARIPPEIRAVL